MNDAQSKAHELMGFPAAASAFVSAFEANQRRLAIDAGLTGTELRALFRVAQVVSMTPKDLATHLGLTTGAVTAISRRLVEVGSPAPLVVPNDSTHGSFGARSSPRTARRSAHTWRLGSEPGCASRRGS